MKKNDLNLNDEITSLTTKLTVRNVNLALYLNEDKDRVSFEKLNTEVVRENKMLNTSYEKLEQLFEKLKAYPCEMSIFKLLQAKFVLKNLYFDYENELNNVINSTSLMMDSVKSYLHGKLSFINKVVNLIEYTLDVCNKFPKGIKRLQAIEDERKRLFPKIKLKGSAYRVGVGFQLGRVGDFFVDYNQHISFDENFIKAFSYTFELYDNGKLVSQKNLNQVLCHTLYKDNEKRTIKHQKEFFCELNRAIERFDTILNSSILEVKLHQYSKSFVKNNPVDVFG